MISIHNIRSIALYETKTLLRSWFFRIFAILAMVFLTFFNFGVLIQSSGGAGEWGIKGLPSIIPYVNLLFLNVVQAVIAIFLASDFLKRDKKLDTTEVIYMRPMTNGEYVIGKTLGNLVVFIVLNLLILVIALIFNLITKNTDVNWITYIYYFLVISVPTLVFIMGLSFLVMSLIRNQAVTFVVLLGYVAISLFYLKSKFYYLFDYMAFNIPLTYSDFVGFGNLDTILIHRGMYLLFGLGFIFYTVLLLRRLPHSESMRIFSLVLGTICIGSGIYLGSLHVRSFLNKQDLRQEMIAQNDQYAGQRRLTVKSYDIKLNHKGETIACEANLKVRNDERQPIATVLFNLNPGLKVDRVTVDGKDQPIERKYGLLNLTGLTVQAGQRVDINFTYHGRINEAACYLDIDDETLEEPYRNFLYQIDKRYAFITPDYVLLTREDNWYPIPGAGYGTKNKQWMARQFSDYKLEVTTRKGLTAVSQGDVQQDGNRFVFVNSHDQSQISLAIGEYERMEKDIDGLDFNIYYRKGHDYFSSFFDEIKDTIPSVVAETMQDFERKVDLYYPFQRFNFLEVPVQFFSYPRILTGAREQIQPETILYTEKGLLNRDADFYGRMNQRRRFGPRRDENQTPQEKKIQILKNFLNNFTEEQGRPDFSRSQGEVQVTEKDNPFYAFPLFYDYAYYIRSSQWPVTDRVFESYKKQGSEDQRMGWMRNFQGMSEDEQGNLALLSHSFQEILNDPDEKQIVDNVIQMKGEALFSIIKRKASDDAFEDFLYRYFNGVKFSSASIDDFNAALKSRFGIDLIPYMANWFSSTKLPAFLIGHVSAVNVLDGDQLKTMVKFKVTNTEDVEGIISVDFRIGGGGGRFGGFGGQPETISKLVHLDGNQTKEVSFLLNGTPRGATINTLTSKNIPSEIRLPLDNIEEDKKAVPYEGEKVVDTPVRIAENNEIISDNEDPGFRIIGDSKTSLLRKLLVPEEKTTSKYAGFSSWRPPSTWTLTTNSNFYGAYIRSAYYIHSGDGDQKAQWNIPIKASGYYDVYAYIYKDERRRRRGEDNGEYHFIVHSDNGEEEVPVDLKTAEDGWNHLGAYYFSPDTAVVELTNQSEARVVVADAVKLIKQ